ncbi:MAG: hypothetical protein LUQ65_00325 [Candidatus Helarchaeota archaeon]|nr:hypothetical protein [Candidatus Helarchaeota archaeon]
MEISKFISDALKDGSIDKVSKGIEQLVMMMINAIGMIERRELEFEKRIETLEEDIDLIKSFLLSNPVPIPKSTILSPPPSQPYPEPTGASPLDQPPHTEKAHPAEAASLPGDQISSVHAGPQEEDILTFRKKLLKPTPKEDKPPTPPVSIRAALMQEIKNYIGTAVDEIKKDDIRKNETKKEKKPKN